MTLDEFVKRSAISVAAFAAATRAHQAEGTEGFVGAHYENRTEADWWREVAAYHEFIEVQEALARVPVDAPNLRWNNDESK